jgi:hypothetical protein
MKTDPNPQPLTEGQKAILDAIPMRDPMVDEIVSIMRDCTPEQKRTVYARFPPPELLPGMSPINRTIAYAAAQKLREIGYGWDGAEWRCMAAAPPTPPIDYTVLHAFADAHHVSYNDLCAAVRRAVGP